MKRLNLSTLILLTAIALTATACNKSENKTAAPSAETGSVTILSPKDGAVLESGVGDKLTYNVKLGPTGNHVHVYIDNLPPIVDRNVHDCPCTLDLPPLTSGKHTLAMKEATSSHALTGVESSITFTVK